MSSHRLNEDDLRKDLATLLTMYLDLIPMITKYEHHALLVDRTGPESDMSKALNHIYIAVGYYENLFEEVSPVDASSNKYEESVKLTLSEPLLGDSEYPPLEEDEFDE